ncbi:hypothetical protein LPB137_00640 [Poseidonibacter parvus]|uniref:Uncharacterized protein n=1 Tax=Poseidonibacter parvus TaxID=1850254 RepID=A0A1P8KIR9_9BACT|nr:hypothetical protein [Poseidonibacter parvus]APW64443.1 hypothetical protein LPB137_00640 [Poseidonibacter parvus]
MLGNIWLSSALIVTAIYSASSLYKSYSDTQEAKQIQENYQIISDIKTLLAEQYNKNPDEVTRDEIMMHLPAGGNWEKVLLLDRNSTSTLENDALVDEDGNFVLDESEQLKLFALRAKLSNLSDSNTENTVDGVHTFIVGKEEKNIVNKNISIDDSLEKAIEYLSTAILYSTLTSSEIEVILEDAIETYTPHSDIYQDMKTSETEVIDDVELAIRKKAFFKKRLEEELLLNKNAMETKLYYHLKDLL